jgi:hypothetical protein
MSSLLNSIIFRLKLTQVVSINLINIYVVYTYTIYYIMLFIYFVWKYTNCVRLVMYSIASFGERK